VAGAAVVIRAAALTGAVHRQRHASGVVLLSVLLVLALLSALAWQLMTRHALVVAQARFTFTSNQSLGYALGGETFARQVLHEEWSLGGAEKDTLLEVWAQPAAPFEIENGYIEIQVRDLHGCFNLNALAGANWEQNLVRLKNLLRNRGVPEALADTWKDWVDTDQEITGFGAEDNDYLLEPIPYRTANQPAADVSEFRLLRGVEREHLEALGALLCVLPSTDLQINVNTAAGAVLASLDENLGEQQMEAFAESVRDFAATGDAIAQIPELASGGDVLSVTSEYFEVNVRARVDDGQTELSSVLRRDPGTGKIHLISRNFGRSFRSMYVADVSESG
jgi:general secretion pathway protein K